MTPLRIFNQLKGLKPEAFAAFLNKNTMGMDACLNLQYDTVSPDKITAHCIVTEDHLQPYGLTHGGIYCSIGESVCSVGATLVSVQSNHLAVGIKNTTHFHKASRQDTRLIIDAEPMPHSTPNQLLWAFTISNNLGTLCASGTVLLAIVSESASVAGQQLNLKFEA
jgi:1,4-dihydroxy-2-naphthoyl-CoA hydrolase